MKLLPLTNGGSTKVDDDTYLWASKEKWYQNDGVVRNTKSMKFLHRLIMDAPKGVLVDHRKHDTLDNQRENLRLCTYAENQMNRSILIPRSGKPKSSRYKGVYRNYNKWEAHISVKGKVIYLGLFPTEKVAALAYNKAATLYFGEFACLNPIEEGCPQCS